MAINTLTPKLRICFDGCSTIKVYDSTGAETVTNTGGYGATNINPADIDSATISYTVPNGSEVTVDVTAAVNAQTTVDGEFLIAEIDITALDGSYLFVYTLTDLGASVVKRCNTYSLCVVRCCVDKLWAQAALGLIEEDCECLKTGSAMDRALLAEGTYKAIVHGTASLNTGVRDALLAKLQRICKLENCNCN